MIDKLFAVFALLLLASFLGIIAWRVPQLPLIVVFSVVFVMAAYDFWRELRQGSTLTLR